MRVCIIDMRMLGDDANGLLCSSGLMGNFTFVFGIFRFGRMLQVL